jgi:dienelactone hydrolase
MEDLAYFAWDIEGAKRAAKEREKKPFVFDEATVQSALDVMRPPTWRMIPLHADLHLMDLRTGRSEKVWTSPGTMQVSDDPAGTIPPELAWSPDGKTIALTYPPKLAAGEYFARHVGLYTVADHSFRPLLTDIGWTLFARWLPDGGALSLSSEGRIAAGKPRHGWRNYEYRFADGSFREVTAPTDVASQAGRAIAEKNNARVTECTTSADLRRVACLYETPRTPPEIAVARLEDGGRVSGVRPVTSLNPEYANIRIGEVTQLSWAWPGGKEDRPGATLIKPIGFVPGKKYPLLVMLYNQGDTNRFVYQTWTNWPTQAFAARGYAILLVNFPRSSFESGDFEGAKRAEADAPVECIEKAIGLVKAMGFLDETRMGILGWSWGSYVASYLISHNPDRFQAAASSEGGLYNISSHWMSVDEGRRFMESPFGGGPYPRFLEKWTQMSPTMSAHRVKIPVLQEYSTRNPSGLEFSTAVNSQGGAAEIVFYPDEVHVFLGPRNRLHSMRLNYDWFNFWLLGEEDPDPSKRAQYDRWRALRETLARRPREDGGVRRNGDVIDARKFR